jgi:hypothetical protein
MNNKKANKVYSLLVTMASASESERNAFVFHHSKKGKCAEWGFGGKLGYGWKYRSETNTVGCYPEDLTALSKEIIENLNEALASL